MTIINRILHQKLNKNLNQILGDSEATAVLPPVTANLFAFYEAEQTDLGSTSFWPDLSGNGRDTLTQGTGSKRPTNTTSQIGGRNGFVFDGNDLISLPNDFNTLAANEYTVFAVFKQDTLGTSQTIFNISDVSNLYRYSMIANDGMSFRNAPSGSSFSVGSGTDSYSIGMFNYDGSANIAGSLNNSIVEPGTGADVTSISNRSIGDRGNGSLTLTGGIATLIFYDRKLTTSETNQVYAWLSPRYSIALDFSPIDYGDQSVWLDGTITPTGSVSNWTDQFSTGNDADQGLGSAQPISTADQINGKNALVYDGTDYLETPFLLDPSATDFTAYVVGEFGSLGTTEVLLQQLDGTGTGRGWLFAHSSDTIRGNVDGSSLIGDAITTNPAIYGVKLESGTLSNFINGATPSTKATPTPNSSDGDLRIGANKALAATLTGVISEVLIYATARSSGENTEILNYLSTKYSILLIPALLELSANLNVTEVANEVSAWGDISSNGWSADQSTGADKPDYSATGFNSTPTIAFNPSTDHLVVPSFDMQSIGTGGFAMICTIDRDQASRGDMITYRTNFGSADNVGFLITNDGTSLRFFYRRGSTTYLDTGSARSGINTKGVPAVVSVVRDDSGNLEMFVNGVSDYTTTGFTEDFTLLGAGIDLWLGSHHNNSNVPTNIFNGNLSDVVIYNRTITTAEREAAEAILTTRRNI